MSICEGILHRDMNFLWSCDTRLNCIDEELLYKMRQAGCQMISLGVESGDQEILNSINKKTTPELVLEKTALARKFGFHIRYYMMILNRGESVKSLDKSIELIKAGRPNSFSFAPLTFFPGTMEWQYLSAAQQIDESIFFTGDFLELSASTHRTHELQELYRYIQTEIGAVGGFKYSVEEREKIIERLPETSSVYLELANAYLEAGRLEEAEQMLARAKAMGFPIRSIIDNQRACIAFAKGDLEESRGFLEKAYAMAPNGIVSNNLNKIIALQNAPGDRDGTVVKLDSTTNFMNY